MIGRTRMSVVDVCVVFDSDDRDAIIAPVDDAVIAAACAVESIPQTSGSTCVCTEAGPSPRGISWHRLLGLSRDTQMLRSG